MSDKEREREWERDRGKDGIIQGWWKFKESMKMGEREGDYRRSSKCANRMTGRTNGKGNRATQPGD